jgi:hypothetical protein
VPTRWRSTQRRRRSMLRNFFAATNVALQQVHDAVSYERVTS